MNYLSKSYVERQRWLIKNRPINWLDLVVLRRRWRMMSLLPSSPSFQLCFSYLSCPCWVASWRVLLYSLLLHCPSTSSLVHLQCGLTMCVSMKEHIRESVIFRSNYMVVYLNLQTLTMSFSMDSSVNMSRFRLWFLVVIPQISLDSIISKSSSIAICTVSAFGLPMALNLYHLTLAS